MLLGEHRDILCTVAEALFSVLQEESGPEAAYDFYRVSKGNAVCELCKRKGDYRCKLLQVAGRCNDVRFQNHLTSYTTLFLIVASRAVSTKRAITSERVSTCRPKAEYRARASQFKCHGKALYLSIV